MVQFLPMVNSSPMEEGLMRVAVTVTAGVRGRTVNSGEDEG